MKKYLNQALGFAIYGLCAGVFYREFSKFNNFTGRGMLGMAHPHILLLGFGWFMLIALFYKQLDIEEDKKSKMANIIYIAGLIIASVTMIFRGSLEVIGFEFSKGLNGAISGIAGIGHMLVAAGMIRYINILRKNAK